MSSRSQPLHEVADVIRSKNAGPFELTLDVIFKDHAQFCRVRDSGLFNPAMIARLYGIAEGDVLNLVHYEPARAIKATIRRHIPSGAIGDRDVYGAQQHAPLLTVSIPLLAAKK
ncbi:MAG: DUF4387 domain-containing protein [Rhodospirillales bacterium]|nr:DUF4387 domain-containing protein [Rhodospirillales bacterium]